MNMLKFTKITFLLFFLLIICSINISTLMPLEYLHAQTDDFEFSLDDEELETVKKWNNEVNFFIELENYINTYTDQEFKDVFKKNELRFNLRYKTGMNTLYFYTDMDLYGNFYMFDKSLNRDYHYSNGFSLSRNLRISGKFYEINFNNLYFNYEVGTLRFRLGNQVFNWGTTDVFNPTSSFNPNDLREFFLRDEGEMKIGIPAFSTLFLFGKDSMEFVVAPIHVPAAMPENTNFWGIKYKEGPFPVKFADTEELSINMENIGVGVQFAKDFFGVDLYLTYFHGPNIEPAIRPIRTIIQPGEPVSILVKPEVSIIDKFGFALSKGIDKFTLQCEFAYTPNKNGVVDQDGVSVTLPFEVRESHHISYSAGVNYFIPLDDWIPKHRGDSVITAEWFQSMFIDKKIMKPMLTDILIIQLQDTFFNNRFSVSFTTMVNVIDVGCVIMPDLEYKFDFGLSIRMAYTYIYGEGDSLLKYYNNKDVLSIRIRYQY